jgi:hypothetical protein
MPVDMTMYSQWLKTEHDRLHIVEEWPEGSVKDAALHAIQSKLASLARSAPADAPPVECEICLNRQLSAVGQLRLVPQSFDEKTEVAA